MERRDWFVRAVDGELRRRGYLRATRSISGAIEWRRSSTWRKSILRLRVEILEARKLRITFANGVQQIDTVEDLAGALFVIDAAEIRAEFGSD